MISQLLHILIAGLILYVFYYLAAMVTSGIILTVIAVILLLVFISYAIKLFGLNL